MDVLIIIAVIQILSFSRIYLSRFQIPRSFYDTLTVLLPLAFIIYYKLSPHLLTFEKKIERGFSLIGKKWAPFLLDCMVVFLAVFFISRAARFIFAEPISCTTADMLPIIRGASENFIALKNPFNQMFCPTYGGFFPYLPMMMVYYIPSTILRLDMRIISLFFCLGLLLSGYIYYRKKGRILTGFLVYSLIITSGLMPLFLITVHTFPYLFVLSVLFLAIAEENDKLAFFSLALALASRKFFWLYLPFFIIYFLKRGKFSLSNLKFFCFGGILGFSPYILFPGDFIKNHIHHVSILNRSFADNLFFEHSIGLSYHLFNQRTFSMIILAVLYVTIIILAVKYLNKNNLWLFLCSSVIVFLYFQVSMRAQEYYFLPLFVFIIFAPLQDIAPIKKIRQPYWFLSILIFLSLLLILFYPYLSSSRINIKPVQRTGSILASGVIQSEGRLELCLGGNLRSGKDIVVLIRRQEVFQNEPVRVKITINDKNFKDDVYRSKKIFIAFDRSIRKKYFYFGGNSLKISFDKPEKFTVRIRREGPHID